MSVHNSRRRAIRLRQPGAVASGMLLAALLASRVIAGIPTASAAEEAANDGGAKMTSSLQEVIVTARKRKENLQDTPISITALSGASLDARGVSNIAEVGNFAPNVSFSSAANISGSSAAMTMFIRGVGQTDFTETIDPGVGLYVDGVYLSRSVGALLDAVDIQSVQVLRGPQGTLFGKNTIGGAVVVTTIPPGRTLSGFADVTTGSDRRFDARAGINLPITDSLRVRLTGATQSQEGYVERLSDGGRMGNRHGESGRAVVEFQPAARFSINLAVDGTRKREQAVPSAMVAVNPLGQFASFWNFALNGSTCFTPPNGLPVPASPRCYSSQWITGNPYKTWAGGGNYSDLDLWGVASTLHAEVGRVDIKLISAYRHLNSRFTVSLDGSPLPVDRSGDDYTERQWSEELQLSGSAFQQRLRWLTGLYYLRESGDDRNGLTFAIADFLSGGSVDNESYAVFTQETLRLTDRLHLTAGGRYTEEIKRFYPDQYIESDFTGGTLLALSRCFIRAFPVVPPSPTCTADPTLNPNGNLILPLQQATAKAHEMTPSVSLDFKPSRSILMYVSYSRGFKAGGFTQRVFPPLPVIPSFKPEFVTAYEIGVKTELLNHRLRWNSAAFWSDYTDLQLLVNSGIAPTVQNAGKALIKGFESELEALPVSGVRLHAGVGYIDDYYASVPASAAPVTTASHLADTPRWTGNLGASVDLWRGVAGALSLRADYSYKGAHFLDAVNSPSLFQGGYSLLSASLDFKSARAWTLTIGGTNLTNRAYLLSGYESLDSLGGTTATYARPREWYARIRYDFGGQ